MAWFRSSGTALLVVCLLLGAAQASEADRAKAREHFVAAKRAFELGHYAEAIKGYEEAYRLVDEPALLYNLGQAHRLAGHHLEALRAYKNFLVRSPEAKNRDEVEKKITQLEKVIEETRRAQNQPPDGAIEPKEPKPKPEPVATPVNKPLVAKQVMTERPRKPLLIGGGLTLTIGVAAVGAGAACALLGSQTKEQLRRDSVAGNEFDPKLESRGKLYNELMGGMFAVGVVAVAAGATLVAIGMKPRPERAWLIVPAVGDRQLGAVVGGRF